MSLSLEQASAGSFCLTKAVLNIGSTTSQLSVTPVPSSPGIVYCIDGVHQTPKAVTATFALAAPSGYALSTIPAGGKANFGVWIDSAGVLTVTQGPTAMVGSNAEKAGPPPNPGGRALIGVASVYTATNAFVPATTAFSATGVTTTYFDTFALPASGF
jgi:hypothetical protein